MKNLFYIIVAFASFATIANDRYITFSCKITHGPKDSVDKTFSLYQESNPSEAGVSLIYGIYFIIPGQESLGEFSLSGTMSNGDFYTIPGGYRKTPESTLPDGYALLNLDQDPLSITNQFQGKLTVLSDPSFELTIICELE